MLLRRDAAANTANPLADRDVGGAEDDRTCRKCRTGPSKLKVKRAAVPHHFNRDFLLWSSQIIPAVCRELSSDKS